MNDANDSVAPPTEAAAAVDGDDAFDPATLLADVVPPNWADDRSAGDVDTASLMLIITGELPPPDAAPPWFDRWLETTRRPAALVVVDMMATDRADRLDVALAPGGIALRMDTPEERSNVSLLEPARLMEVLTAPLDGTFNEPVDDAPTYQIDVPAGEEDLTGIGERLAPVQPDRVVRYATALGHDATTDAVRELMLVHGEHGWWRCDAVRSEATTRLDLRRVDNAALAAGLAALVAAP